MKSVLNGIPGVTVYLDILVTVATEEHLTTLDEVLRRITGTQTAKGKMCLWLHPWCIWGTNLMLKACTQ